MKGYLKIFSLIFVGILLLPALVIMFLLGWLFVLILQGIDYV